MRQRLFTIAPDAAFLPTLAARIVDGTLLGDWPRQGPFWLTDVTVLLPTRRARAALADAFVALGSHLLPDIRSLGEEDVEAEPFLPPFDSPPEPPAASAMERRLVLARLVAKWSASEGGPRGQAGPAEPAEAVRLADSLAALVDDLIIERVAPAALAAIAPENLAENWQHSLRFLHIALAAWPAILAAGGKVDAAARRAARLAREAESVRLRYGDRPVIVAGSTGSQATTAELIRAIIRLPRGAVVLPGLDTTLRGRELAQLTDPTAAPHAHAQYGLVKLLTVLGAEPEAVTELAVEPPPARRRIVRRALAPADATADWLADRAALAGGLEAGLAGVAVLAAPNEAIEARAIAIAARQALEAGRRVGIVASDRTLARRIAAELGRVAVAVDDSAGTPLFQSPAGRLVRALLAVAVERFAPVPLMGLLRHRAVMLGLGRRELTRGAGWLEFGLLRGQPRAIGLAGLKAVLAANRDGRLDRPVRRLTPEQAERVVDLLDRLAAALAPLCTLLDTPQIDAPRLAAALAAALAAVTAVPPGEPAPRLPGSDEFAAWAQEIAEADESGPAFRPAALAAVLAALMAGAVVRPQQPARTDISIWGRLEARLQRADFTVLAGLNEDVWPEPADPGPWLSRGMRLAAGLEPPERRQGQAAHDFEMAMGGREILLAFADRRGPSPALPSPLLQRLEAFVGGDQAKALRQRGARWLDLAHRLDATAGRQIEAPPKPRPQAGLRPRRLSVTDVETMIRSPYDIYAKYVLRLKRIEPLGGEVGARERGTIIHSVFARFVEEGYDLADPGAEAVLERLAAEAFGSLDSIPEQRTAWLRRFRRAAARFLAYERAREPEIARRHAEVKGDWTWPNGFVLTGRADRIDRRLDGGFEIIDFKTGNLPSVGAMQGLLAPQLLLEAAMVEADAFEGIRARGPAALTYVKVGLGPQAFLPRPFALPKDVNLGEMIERMTRDAQGWVDRLLLRDDMAFIPNRLPVRGRRYAGTYDHLARTGEWRRDDEVEDDE
jgi:ATP-dependent helicase/nuclease subunit B